MKVFGLKEIGRKIPEYLMKDVKYKNDPTKWNWEPYDPWKISNIKEIITKEHEETAYTVISNYEPNDSKQNVVLCFGMGNLSFGLLNQFYENDIKYFYVDFVQFFAKHGEVSIALFSNVFSGSISIDGVTLKLTDVEFVLWNPPQYPTPFFDFSMIPPKKGRNKYLFEKRWQNFICSLERILEDAIWIPGPPSLGSQDWQNKIGEYYLASKIGLNVPDLLLSNNKQAVQQFMSTNLTTLLREFSCPPYSFPPIPMNNRKNSLVNLNVAPCSFQQYIEKKFEFRVVILFEEIYAFKIYSRDSVLTKKDWRVHDDANVKWELATLPDELKNKLLLLRKSLCLNWISVDLILAPDGMYYFLEANRPGAHYWLHMFTGFDITEKIVKKIKEYI